MVAVIMAIKLVSLLLVALLSYSEPSSADTSADHLILLRQACDSLSKALSFLSNVADRLTLDGLLGVVIAREQSKSLLELIDANTGHSADHNTSQVLFVKRKLSEVHQRAVQVSTAMPYAWRQDPQYFCGKSFRLRTEKSQINEFISNGLEIGRILSGSIWSKLICHSKDFPLGERHQHPHQHQPSSAGNYTLNERVSDACLSELLNGCHVSAFCWTLFTAVEFDEYPLAHQVFYLTIARSMDCLSKLPPPVAATVDAKITALCSSMFRVNLRVEARNYPSEDQDLFMQNIAFCGLSGYRPFRERLRWLEVIRSWQRSQPGAGCFPVNLHQLARMLAQSRPKRRERILADGCSLHKTSMALAAVSVYVQTLSAPFTGCTTSNALTVQ